MSDDKISRLLQDPTDSEAITVAVDLVVDAGRSALPSDLKIGGQWVPIDTIADHLIKPLLVEGLSALIAALTPSRAEVRAEPGAAVTMKIHDEPDP